VWLLLQDSHNHPVFIMVPADGQLRLGLPSGHIAGIYGARILTQASKLQIQKSSAPSTALGWWTQNQDSGIEGKSNANNLFQGWCQNRLQLVFFPKNITWNCLSSFIFKPKLLEGRLRKASCSATSHFRAEPSWQHPDHLSAPPQPIPIILAVGTNSFSNGRSIFIIVNY
jgi:hypothetical protein